MKLERTCKCIKDLTIPPREGSLINRSLSFLEKHEYQVDINNFDYRVYINGGWYGYIDLKDEEFEKHFKLIE